jgi:Raf kinase inhibitor-like YbhB/YbcL family protein
MGNASRTLHLLAATLTLTVVLAACGGAPLVPLPTPEPDAAALTVTSDQFLNAAQVRPRYTCDGLNISPGVTWSGVPEGTVALALVLEDPEAPGGVFTHWLVYDIPADLPGLEEGRGGALNTINLGGVQGMNSYNSLGYAGPCPPHGEAHTYTLHLYALDALVAVGPRGERAQVLEAMAGHIIGYGAFSGLYARTNPSEVNVVFGGTPTPTPAP